MVRGKRPIPIASKRKIAFVCSGGATKAGAFHLGVALALHDHGFRFLGGLHQGKNHVPGPMEISTYVGSSAGSMICAYLAAGYSLENIFDSFLGREPSKPTDRPLSRLTYNKMFKIRPEMAREQFKQLWLAKNIVKDLARGNWEALLQFKWLRTTGLFSTRGIEEFMRREVLPSNRFQDYLADLFVVATQLNHSRKVVFGKYNYQPPPHDLTCQYDSDIPISDACAASTSLPGIYSPYAISDQNHNQVHYVDGEIRDTLSSHVAIDAGADLVIASHTHQPYHFIPEVGSLVHQGLPAILIQSIYLVIEQKINNHVHNKEVQRNAIDAVDEYCLAQGVAPEHRQKILSILQSELHHRRDVDTIYIHPSPTDSAMFFGEHFTLNPEKLSDMVRSGFRAAKEVLRKHEFADRKVERRRTKRATA